MRYPRIRDLREDRDLYQRDLAEYLHCTQVTYSRYELGTRDIPTEVLIALADFYQTSIDYLLGQTDLVACHAKRKKMTCKTQKNTPTSKDRGVFIR